MTRDYRVFELNEEQKQELDADYKIELYISKDGVYFESLGRVGVLKCTEDETQFLLNQFIEMFEQQEEFYRTLFEKEGLLLQNEVVN